MATNRRSLLRSDQYRTALRTLARRVTTITSTVWSSVTTVDEPTEDQFVRTLVPYVLGAQALAVSVTDAYMASYLTAELGQEVNPKGLAASSLVGLHARNGTPLDTVYRRPFGVVRGALADGAPFGDAMERGAARAVQSARMDVALAARSAGSAWMDGDKRLTGWRRATSGTACGLCAGAANGKVQRTDVVMPMHPGCSCFAEPVALSARHPLPQPKPTISDGSKPEPFQIVDHGELGPVLYEPGHNFSDS